jgi:heme exporter protein D
MPPKESIDVVRYPFHSIKDFFLGGYFLDPGAIHLNLGFLFIFIFFLGLMLHKKINIFEKLTILFLALVPFNNFAYSFLGIKLHEFAGIFCIFMFIFAFLSNKITIKKSPVGLFLLTLATIIAIHSLTTSIFFPQVNEIKVSTTLPIFIVRTQLIAKIFVTGAIFIIFDSACNSPSFLTILIKKTILAGSTAFALYLLQMVLFISGIKVFGVFLDAGNIGFPSFGSVSLERGHFGKFTSILFPYFLIGAIHYRKKLNFVLYSIVTLINFSASSMAFFFCYSLLTYLAFIKRFLKPKLLLLKGFVFSILIYVFISFYEMYAGIVKKIFKYVVYADKRGGRSIDILYTYFQEFPMGITYGGSTIRSANLIHSDEMNMGLYAFFAQLSFIAPLAIISMVFLYIYAAKSTKNHPDQASRKILVVSMITSFLIFAADILWFVPTLWLVPALLFKMRDPKNSLLDSYPS